MNKYEIKNAWNRIDKSEESSIEKFSFEYMDFIDRSKTERVCINEIRRTAKEHGFVDLDKLISENTKLIPGMKIYAENNHKSAVLFVIGDEPIENGFKMVGSHVDSPRIDLKPNPLYEDSNLALFKTHYYGGIKKYQWATIPLSLYGTVYNS